jgi:hypothetical protein
VQPYTRNTLNSLPMTKALQQLYNDCMLWCSYWGYGTIVRISGT